MPITIDMRKSLLFKQGEAEGRAKGEAKGETKGIQKAKKEDVLNLYTKLNLAPEQIAKILNLSTTFVISTLEESGMIKT